MQEQRALARSAPVRLGELGATSLHESSFALTTASRHRLSAGLGVEAVAYMPFPLARKYVAIRARFDEASIEP
jgi:hypothetical protein